MIQPIPNFQNPTLHNPSALPPAPPITLVITHGDIAQRAHDIYTRSGNQEGRSQQNWEQAEKDLHDSGLLACHAEHVRNEVFAPDAVVD